MDRYQETFATWDKIAELYASTFSDLELYNDTYDLFLSCLSKGPHRILEIGCGPGNITSYLLRQSPELQVEGIDVAPNMIDLASKNNPTATFYIMDARQMHLLKPGFQGILSGFCLPYCSPEDRKKWIEDCAQLLADDGMFYLSFVPGSTSDSGYQTGSSGDRTYFYYHPLEDVKRELEENGFGEIQVIIKEYRRSATQVEEHAIFLARKMNH
ncbi:MAG: methyltransferase domain-containing protein [Saprospiraceae bacterium]|nr:methyltransferase domain-containing protein [Saprospiraceae bacterium]